MNPAAKGNPSTFTACACCERAFASDERIYDTQMSIDAYGISCRVPLCATCRGDGGIEQAEAIRSRLEAWVTMVLAEAASLIAPTTCNACGSTMATGGVAGRFIDPRTGNALSICDTCFSPQAISDLTQSMIEKSATDGGGLRH